LGILPNEQMDFVTDCFFFDRPGFVFAHSDGLTEARRGDRDVFGLPRVLDALADASGDERLVRVQNEFAAFMGGESPHDDVSMVLAHFLVAAEPWVARTWRGAIEVALEEPNLAWQYSLRLGVAELKTFRTVPFLMSFVNGIQSLRSSRADVYRVLRELAEAALAQGVLGLSVCGNSGGDMQHQAQLDLALAHLQSGWLELQLSWYVDQGKPALLIRAAWLPASGQSLPSLSLPVANALCVDVRYNSLSNEVLACYIPA
jgi:hypothetical protein